MINIQIQTPVDISVNGIVIPANVADSVNTAPILTNADTCNTDDEDDDGELAVFNMYKTANTDDDGNTAPIWTNAGQVDTYDMDDEDDDGELALFYAYKTAYTADTGNTINTTADTIQISAQLIDKWCIDPFNPNNRWALFTTLVPTSGHWVHLPIHSTSQEYVPAPVGKPYADLHGASHFCESCYAMHPHTKPI